jgi:hypothetical protein
MVAREEVCTHVWRKYGRKVSRNGEFIEYFKCKFCSIKKRLIL